jgi:Rieske Fe-S protein
MLGGGLGVMAAGATIPLVPYVGNFRPEPLPPFVEVAEGDANLAPGKSRILRYGSLPVLLLRPPGSDRDLKVFVATCTHLNCTVHYQEEKDRILCACHDGVFDTNGRVLSGPPTEPLREVYAARKQGKLFLALEKGNLEKAE